LNLRTSHISLERVDGKISVRDYEDPIQSGLFGNAEESIGKSDNEHTEHDAEPDDKRLAKCGFARVKVGLKWTVTSAIRNEWTRP
jgi:hypothetical protein